MEQVAAQVAGGGRGLGVVGDHRPQARGHRQAPRDGDGRPVRVGVGAERRGQETADGAAPRQELPVRAGEPAQVRQRGLQVLLIDPLLTGHRGPLVDEGEQFALDVDEGDGQADQCRDDRADDDADGRPHPDDLLVAEVADHRREHHEHRDRHLHPAGQPQVTRRGLRSGLRTAQLLPQVRHLPVAVVEGLRELIAHLGAEAVGVGALPLRQRGQGRAGREPEVAVALQFAEPVPQIDDAEGVGRVDPVETHRGGDHARNVTESFGTARHRILRAGHDTPGRTHPDGGQVAAAVAGVAECHGRPRVVLPHPRQVGRGLLLRVMTRHGVAEMP